MTEMNQNKITGTMLNNKAVKYNSTYVVVCLDRYEELMYAFYKLKGGKIFVFFTEVLFRVP